MPRLVPDILLHRNLAWAMSNRIEDAYSNGSTAASESMHEVQQAQNLLILREETVELYEAREEKFVQLRHSAHYLNLCFDL